MKEILNQAKQSVDVNKNLHLTVTLTITFLNPVGEEHPYVQFVYAPHTILNKTRVQISVPIKYDHIDTNKQVNNKNANIKTKTPTFSIYKINLGNIN